jgi:hypothetical protein
MLGHDVGQPDARTVAVGFVGQVTHHDAADVRMHELGYTPDQHPADDVGIHPRARDVLSHLINHEDINVIERQ